MVAMVHNHFALETPTTADPFQEFPQFELEMTEYKDYVGLEGLKYLLYNVYINLLHSVEGEQPPVQLQPDALPLRLVVVLLLCKNFESLYLTTCS